MSAAPQTISPNIDGSLEDWLENQIVQHDGFFRQRPLLLDVGAYHGDFSRRFAGPPNSLFLEAVLFEPNPENFTELRQQFASDKRFRLEPRACADRAGSGKLHCQGERYTGSLLDYQGDRPGSKSEHDVSVTTVDAFLSGGDSPRAVGLIKIDTQGNDLRVLQGAVGALRTHRPWLVVEMLATPRFVNQATPLQIMQFLAAEKYFLAAQFNEFYTATGWLAWYDACFVPQELFSMDVTANLPRPTAVESKAAAGREHPLRKKWGRIFKAG